MQNTTPMFPSFHFPTLRRTPRSARQKLVDEMAKIKQKSFSEIAEYLAHIVPTAPLKKPLSGTMSRNRIFSCRITGTYMDTSIIASQAMPQTR
jgi:hypothetical protein